MSLLGTLRALVIGASFLAAGAAGAADEHHIAMNGYGTNGYDPVAYFTENAARPGRDAHTAEHDGVVYRFASAENRDAFAASPGRYAPQYGGFCAFGTAMGYKVRTDPEAFSVVDGKLYLNFSKGVRSRWNGQRDGFIRGADNNWPLIRSIAADALRAAPPAGVTLGAQ